MLNNQQTFGTRVQASESYYECSPCCIVRTQHFYLQIRKASKLTPWELTMEWHWSLWQKEHQPKKHKKKQVIHNHIKPQYQHHLFHDRLRKPDHLQIKNEVCHYKCDFQYQTNWLAMQHPCNCNDFIFFYLFKQCNYYIFCFWII